MVMNSNVNIYFGIRFVLIPFQQLQHCFLQCLPDVISNERHAILILICFYCEISEDPFTCEFQTILNNHFIYIYVYLYIYLKI